MRGESPTSETVRAAQSPTTTWITREAMEDFTYNDLNIKRGTTIHLFSESAGTDPRQFALDFNIAAQRKPHFGFGGGAHHCRCY